MVWLHEAGVPSFTREERKFLSRAGRARVPIDTLVERVEAIIGTERPTRGRQRYLAGKLMEQQLFATYEEALAFAQSYYTLAKAGAISPHLLWDWE
jgi:hypothetical protein